MIPGGFWPAFGPLHSVYRATTAAASLRLQPHNRERSRIDRRRLV